MTEQFSPVSRGPFKGMKFAISRIDGTINYTKLLGTYEVEIHPFVYDAIAKKPTTIINIGGGDGYYSIGFSLLFPESKIISYEGSEDERKMHNSTMNVNEVKNCELKEFCKLESLLDLDINKDTLIICDCEGYELEIFKDELFDKFPNFIAIIETHDINNPIITETLVSKFRSRGYITYVIENIKDSDKPLLYNIDEIKDVPEDHKWFMLRERPNGMKWMYCKKIT